MSKTANIPLRKSLSYQQTKNTVVVAFIIGVILSSVQIYIDYFTEQSQTQESVNNALATADSAAFHAAFNIDETGALQITRGLVSNHPIIEATIADDTGKILGTALNNKHPATPAIYARIFGPLETITHTLHNETIHPESVGQLRIVVDPSLTAESFMQRALVVFLAGFVRNIILAISIFLVFYLTFTRSILKASRPIIGGKDNMELAMPDNHAEDEIGVLIGAFNEHIAIIEQQKRQIEATNENLESLVDTRTQQLDQRNRELELERALAIEASMAKTEFLAMMSHEIRTPMSGILGMAELLAFRSDDEKQRDYAHSIIESSKSLLTLMNSVLDYSKYEQGQMPFEKAVFNPTQLVYSIIFLLSASAESKHIVLNSEIDPNVPKVVYGDPEKLRQVLLNLITNAIKFTFNGHVTVAVSVTETTVENSSLTDDSIHLQFSVSDSGIGIGADELEHIFEPYTQANSSINHQFGGSGMGLAICRAIVEQQEGTICCQSPVATNETISTGSSFIFELPFQRSSERVEPHPAPEPTEAIPSLRVLVVDDLSINRKLAQGQLENAGHTVFLASGGNEALTVLEQESVDAVLMDLHMPGLDGIQTTHKIRLGQASQVPIIGITANVSEQKMEECIAAGMDRVIKKPVDQNKLVLVLKEALQFDQPSTYPNSPARNDDIIDAELISQHLQSLGEEEFITLYDEAMDSVNRRVESLLTIDRDIMQLVRDEAHALAGLCANFGFQELSLLAERIEDSSETQVEHLLTDIEERRDSCYAQLRDQFPALSTS